MNCEAALRARTLDDLVVGRLPQVQQLSTMDRIADRPRGTRNEIARSRVSFAYRLERIRASLLIIRASADEAVHLQRQNSGRKGAAQRLVPDPRS